MIVLSAESNNDVQELKVHLPNYLTGVHVFFHEIDQSTVQRLRRFVYTYVRAGEKECSQNRFLSLYWLSFDGHVDDIADARTTTHILANGDCRDSLALHDACPKARVINVEWLDACVRQSARLDTDAYKL